MIDRNIKTVILCGGTGTRLREETEFKPKPLVEIGERPILWHIMKIYSHYGYKNFVLPLGYKGEMIKEYFMHYDWVDNDFGLELKTKKLTYYSQRDKEDWKIDFVDTDVPSKTALRLYKLKKYLQDMDMFMLTYGDGVADINIDALLDYHRKKNKVVTITALHPRSKYGVLATDGDGLVKEFKEKPVLDDFINGGFMVFDKRIWEHLDDRNVMLVDDTLPRLAGKKEVALFNHEGFWHCMDTYKDYMDLNKMWEDKPVWKIWE